MHLFFQVNHPDVIEEFANVLTDLVNDDEIFYKSFSSMYADMIRSNQLNKQDPFDQKLDETCYACASSAAIQLALCRIYSREIPSFESIIQPILNKYGYNGYSTYEVLKEQCPKYGLHVKK